MNLESVQVGDTLILTRRHRADSEVVTVSRLTKTQIIVGIGDSRFRKSDGGTVGASLYGPHLAIPEEGDIKEISDARLRRQLIGRVSNACEISRLRALPLEKLQQLSDLLETTGEADGTTDH